MANDVVVGALLPFSPYLGRGCSKLTPQLPLSVAEIRHMIDTFPNGRCDLGHCAHHDDGCMYLLLGNPLPLFAPGPSLSFPSPCPGC